MCLFLALEISLRGSFRLFSLGGQIVLLQSRARLTPRPSELSSGFSVSAAPVATLNFSGNRLSIDPTCKMRDLYCLS